MSRAFVDEDASREDGDDFALKIPVPPGSRNYLTPEGADALSRELAELSEADLPRAAAELNALMSGPAEPDRDLLSAAKKRLADVERRISYLRDMAALAEVVRPPESDPGRVTFGAWVLVREADGSEREYRIVGIDEADPDRGWIGWPSPLARALTGRKAGAASSVKLPEGERAITIVSYRRA